MLRIERSGFQYPLAGVFALMVAAAACGGGGGAPPPAPEALRVLVADGDTVGSGFTIGTIESANMDDEGTVFFIASEATPVATNAVFRREGDGSISTILRSNDSLAEGLDFSVVRNLDVSETGEVGFEVGNKLDDDAIFYWDDGELLLVARTGLEPIPGEYRIGGAIRAAAGGTLVFTSGHGSCTVDETDPDREEIRCDTEIHRVQDGQVSRVEVPNSLEKQRPTSVLVETNSVGDVVLGLVARGSDPIVARIDGVDGAIVPVLFRRQGIPGLGTITSLRVRSYARDGAILLDGFLDVDGDGERDEEHVFIYRDGTVASIAVGGGVFEGYPETDIRAEAISDEGTVVYRVDFESEAAGDTLKSFRAQRNGETTAILHEGLKYGEDERGRTVRILSVEQIRVARNGDVLFVVKLGDNDPETGDRTIYGTALIRWTWSKGLQTILELGQAIEGKTLVDDLSIADVSSNGNVLVITSLDRERDRVVVLLPRD